MSVVSPQPAPRRSTNGHLPLHTWVSDHFEVPLPPGHPFPMPKYATLRQRLLEENLLYHDELHLSELAPVEWLHLSHSSAYVNRALEGELSRQEVRRLGLPWSPELVRRARGAIYGTVMAARAAIANGIAGNLAGGTHHAFPDRGEGYCLFNDLATAIVVLRQEGHVRRALIVDLDVHQGNGTASHFAGDDTVFTFSMHAASNYPIQKETSTLDVGLPNACGDDEYLAQLEKHLPRAFEQHHPDLVLYQAGVDGLFEDRLGHLSLTLQGLLDRDRRVFAECEKRGVPVVVTLGGGYAQPIEVSIAAHMNVWRAARRKQFS